MLKKLDTMEAKTIISEIQGKTWQEVRAICATHGITPATVVEASAAKSYLLIMQAGRNPMDYGIDGKLNEAIFRIECYLEKNYILHVRDFYARKQGIRDNGLNGYTIEDKSAVGDWLYSKDNMTMEGIVSEYAKKSERCLIRWNFERCGVYICTTWEKLFSFLAAYNPEKGLASWFKAPTQRGESGKTVLQMNTIHTSKKKINYLLSWDEKDNIL